MKTMLTALLLTVALWHPACGEVKITSDSVSLNTDYTSCGWRSLEALAKHHKFKRLAKAAGARSGLVRPGDLEKLIVAEGYKCYEAKGTSDEAFLKAAVRYYGAVVGFRPKPGGVVGHAVTLLDYDDKHAKYLDPDDGLIYTVSREWFDWYWNGWAVTPTQ